MVNRSPSSNFAFRHILNMAPQQTGSKNTKGKQIKRLASKFPPGSAQPVVRQKRKVLCSKCKEPHFPPTGRACQKVELAPNPDLSAPNPDLSSTLANTEEQPPVTSPSLSPVRRDPETQAALDMLQQAHLIANASPTLSPVRADPNTPAAQAQLINNLLDRFGHKQSVCKTISSSPQAQEFSSLHQRHWYQKKFKRKKIYSNNRLQEKYG